MDNLGLGRKYFSRLYEDEEDRDQHVLMEAVLAVYSSLSTL